MNDHVLITGFEPFGDQPVNPSALVARALHGRRLAGRNLEGVVLPCVFGRALRELKRHLRRVQPELVICLGQAGGRSAVAVERVAINVDDARMPDNAGRSPIDEPIAARGPVAYWSTLPIKAIVRALREADIPAEVSQTAGTFVCNHVFYGLMRRLAGRKHCRGGFIHIPFMTGQGEPSLPLEVMVNAIELAVATSLRTVRDRRLAEGATH